MLPSAVRPVQEPVEGLTTLGVGQEMAEPSFVQERETDQSTPTELALPRFKLDRVME